MIGQSKISSFFTKVNSKRTSDEAPDDQKAPSATKKPKFDESEAKDDETKPASKSTNEVAHLSPTKDVIPTHATPTSSPESKTPISPEQRSRMFQSKLAASIKLAEKKTHGLLVNCGQSWFTALEPEFSKEYFIKLGEFVASERKRYTIYPPAEQVFSWTNNFDINKTKVVILGQDPYHGPKQAHGLAFSVQKGISPPPSLVNIYKELATDIEGFQHPGHGTLTGWADQGVLMLNACLTVRASQANSHKDRGWEKVTDAVIRWLNKNLSDVVFILWGSYAQKKGTFLDKRKHHILKGVHPSPLSAHRGFMGCKHFSKCNQLLEQSGKTPIDWTHLPPMD
ncbi:unnamed protein product [Owenia fusiformis]|uniref:Uracil-DNA glycosylase n=1 Tax=Owenia fusiformis TaxID=6347 RepID=A0A8S4NRK8_OWEFU|nr:unnamed protein product [Owenia fusiformis]